MKRVWKVYAVMAATALVGTVATTVSANMAHQSITGPFANPMEVTKQCLNCHADAARDVMQTSHWTWSLVQEIEGRGKVDLGKKNAINNFCIGVSGGNEPRCTSCHIGYGWEDSSFDFNDQSRVDCLICHDTTGTYAKPSSAAGMPFGYTGDPKLDEKKVDLVKIAQQAGAPGKANCVVCHGYGGGGDNVKHGDIDSQTPTNPRSVDVHMGVDGLNYSCQDCHQTEKHNIKGHARVTSPGGTNALTCTQCHQEAPHKNALLNRHVDAVACQTCHIPAYAKTIPTKLVWDWSTAGQDLEVPPQVFGEKEVVAYDKKKGHFEWGMNVTPVYLWYNGSGGAYLVGDKIDPAQVTRLNWPNGDINDRRAKIYPFKEHQGKQIYDAKHNYLLIPKVWPAGKDADAAFWKSFDWQAAAKAGSEASGLAYSGEYAFASTTMYWRLNHMVSPAKEALKCNDCHSPQGRLDWQALGYEGDPMKNRGAARSKK